jgi:hypothetical protein
MRDTLSFPSNPFRETLKCPGRDRTNTGPSCPFSEMHVTLSFPSNPFPESEESSEDNGVFSRCWKRLRVFFGRT